MILKELVKLYYQQAKENDKEVFAIKQLLLEVLGKSSTSFYLDQEEEIEEKKVALLNSYVDQYLAGKPIAYILGYQYFYHRTFTVNQDVLIPRFETEELVDWVLKSEDQEMPLEVFDIGSGSGAIGLSLKLEAPKWNVYVSDISQAALIVAHDNGVKLGANVEYLLGDMLEPLIEEQLLADVIVSNPPYISKYEIIDVSVHKYEPHIALYASENGLGCYIKLLKKIPLVMKDQGRIYLEIGYKQKEAIADLIRKYLPGINFEFKKDINGKDRMVKIYYNTMQLKRESL